MLLERLQNNPHDSRSMFYLAQTYGCLRQTDKAFEWYKKRIEHGKGFQEEIYHSYLRAGIADYTLYNRWNQSMEYFLNAINHSPDRIEGYAHIIKYYCTNNKWDLAFVFANTAINLCRRPYKYVLFDNQSVYDYWIHHYYSVICINIHKSIQVDQRKGFASARKAIEYSTKHNLDTASIDMEVHRRYLELFT